MAETIINGVTLEINLLDADKLENYQDLMQRIVKDVQEPTQYKGKSTADGMRIQCRHIDKFFDDLFGEGTALEVFGDNNDFQIRLEGFAQVAEMSKDINEKVSAIQEKYSFGRINARDAQFKPGNRKQRRSMGKHHK